ncbi:hypothetical protein ZWY2020_010936 [Hordeum vulgare]|nr:hypothetical protein ZWY2020_010936 [Hordeum vulgare]
MIDDYPEEKTKHLSKLQRQAEAGVRKFNEESAAAAIAATSSAAETSGTAIPQVKHVPQKPKASKPQEKLLQKAPPASAPKPSETPKASKPEQKQIVKQLPTVSSSSVPSPTSSETKSSPTPMKTKLPPGISHMVATFINEAKWKETQAKQAKAAKLKKEKFLTQNLLGMTPDALVSTQAELKTLTDKYTKLSDRQSLKNNFIKFATNAVDDYKKKAAPPPTPL